jgi:hypothetical protein
MLTMRGPSAELRVGYRTAAELGAWQITTGAGGAWTCTASAVRKDDYWFDRGPMTLVVPFGARWLRFAVDAVSGNGTLSISGSARPETI